LHFIFNYAECHYAEGHCGAQVNWHWIINPSELVIQLAEVNS
jgi:hypothetical protein